MASVDGGLPERIKLAASCAGAGRQALNTLRLLHYDVTAGSVTVLAIAYQLPAAAPAHALQEALGGTVAQSSPPACCSVRMSAVTGSCYR